jgi:hypothetical protein
MIPDPRQQDTHHAAKLPAPGRQHKSRTLSGDFDPIAITHFAAAAECAQSRNFNALDIVNGNGLGSPAYQSNQQRGQASS